MNKNSNAYIFTYATILVVVAAVVLTLAAKLLKETQDKNIRIEKMQNILASVGIQSTTTEAETIYNKTIVEELVVNPAGELVGEYKDGKFTNGNIRAFDVNLKAELTSIQKTKNGSLPIFVAKMDGKKYYIIPLLGKGLWAAVWGNLALESDLNTVYGANFDHKSETPGLGAEIAQKPAEGKIVFADQFKGKKLFDSQGAFKSISVVKGGVANQSVIPVENGVDAISGGTLTSNGVSDMIRDNLINYVNYIKKQNTNQ